MIHALLTVSLTLAGCGAPAVDAGEAVAEDVAALSAASGVYNIVTQMSHNDGSASGPNQWTLTRSSAGPHMTYGPYAKGIPWGENFAWTTVKAIPAPGATVNVKWDGQDRKRQQLYFTRDYATSTQKVFYPAAMVQMPDETILEFRIDTDGNGTLVQGNLQILSAAANRDQEFTSGGHQYHQLGAAAPNQSWTASVGGPGCESGCSGKFLAYGPYVQLGRGSGPYVAAFSLSLEPNVPVNAHVATLDVLYRKADGTVRTAAVRDIYRDDFEFGGQVSYFPLEFTAPEGSTSGWEFRVRWYGVGTLTQQRTTIYKVF